MSVPLTTIPITVELGRSITPKFAGNLKPTFERRLETELAWDIQQRWGLADQVAVQLQQTDSKRALRVRAHGMLLPYPPQFMRRIWQASSTESQLDVARLPDASSEPGFPVAWLERFAAHVDAGDSTLATFLAYLVRRILRNHAAAMIGPEQAAAFALRNDIVSESEVQRATPYVQEVLRYALRLGMRVGDSDTLTGAMRDGFTLGYAPDEVGEIAYSSLTRRDGFPVGREIRIHAHDEVLAALNPPPERLSSGEFLLEHLPNETQQRFGALGRIIWAETGLRMPPIRFARATWELQRGTFSVQVDRAFEVPLPGLQRGEIAVRASVTKLAHEGLKARHGTDPISGGSCAIVETNADDPRLATSQTLDPAEFMAHAVREVFIRKSDRFVRQEEVEYALAQLERFWPYPELVRVTLERVPVLDLVQVLRALLRERVSIVDLALVLQALVEVPPAPHVPRDQRVLRLVAAARRALRQQIGHTLLRGADTLEVFRLHPRFEARIRQVRSGEVQADPALLEAETELLRDEVWSELRRAHHPSHAVVLASAESRAVVRSFLEPEFPTIAVVAREELGSDVQVKTVATIGDVPVLPPSNGAATQLPATQPHTSQPRARRAKSAAAGASSAPRLT